MKLQNYNKDNISKMSLVELAKLIMLEEKKQMKFNEIFDKVTTLKGLTEQQKSEKISQFYTDLNVDGNCVSNGSNMWGLKRWTHASQTAEDDKDDPPQIVIRRRKRRRVKEDEEVVDIDLTMIDEDVDEFDEVFDIDDEVFDFDLDEEYEDYDHYEERELN